MKKFILMCADGRCGSTLVKHILNQHSKIVCFGEIFNAEHPFLINGHNILKSKNKSHALNQTCDFNKHIGFKVLWHQISSLNINEMKDICYEKYVVFLFRESFLDNYISLYLANKQNKFNGGPYEKERFRVNIRHFLDWVECQKHKISRMTKFLSGNMLGFSEVFYEDLCKDPEKEIKKVYDLLEIEPEPFVITLLKQQIYPLDEILINYKQLARINDLLV